MNKVDNIYSRLMLLSALGICFSAYLIYHHENIVGGYNLGQSFCNISEHFNCDDVAKSRFSSFFGIPVASFGLIYFLLIFTTALFAEKTENGLKIIGLSSLMALLPSLVLFFISAVVIKKYCLFCILLDLTLICILLITFRYIDSLSISNISEFFKGLKTKFYVLLPINIVFAFSLPWLFRHYVLEAAVRENVIKGIYESWNKSPELNLRINSDENSMLKDFALGSANPKITLVEFSDFQCPFCKLASKNVKQIIKRWPNEVRVVFKNFPLDTLCNLKFQSAPHNLACQAAVMARCAGLQGDDKFWQFHDDLFGLEQWDVESLIKISNKYSAEKIDACFKEGTALKRVRSDADLGNEIEITSTPSFFINNKRVAINRLDQLEKLIEYILLK